MAKENRDINKVIDNERNMRMLIDNTDDPMWFVGTDYNIIECNSAFKKWVAYFIGAELGKGDNALYNGKNKVYHDKFEMCYRLALSGRSFRSVEDMLVDNETRYTNVSFNPVYDSKGNVIGVSCFAKDITEHRKHLFRIEQQNAALREIAFIESHKVRGPVATILGLEQFYNYDNPCDPNNKEIVSGIKSMILELDSIIRQVVKLSNEIDKE